MSSLISYDKIVKNQTLLNNINSIVKNNKLTNSYIIQGLEGSGKTLIAKYFAKALLCENFDNNVCNTCKSCLNFDNNNLPDVLYITSKKKTLSIEEVRNKILDTAIVKPRTQKYKIYIIESNEITIQAQNSLLKTIEQPPEYAIFIFMTSKIDLILPTIISRCTLFKTEYIEKELVYNFLKSNYSNLEEHNILCGANFETGSIGQALKISNNNDFESIRYDILQIINNLNNATILDCVNMAKSCDKYKNNSDLFFKILINLYRDLLIYKSKNNKELVNQKEIFEDIQNVSCNINLAKISQNFNHIFKAINFSNMNNSFQLNLETLFIKLSNNIKGDTNG